MIQVSGCSLVAELSFLIAEGGCSAPRPPMPTTARIAPMLSVRRGRDAVDFYQAAFDARALFRIGDEQGAVVAQLSANGADFWVADESPEHENFSPA
jgi:hypothetical protein